MGHLTALKLVRTQVAQPGFMGVFQPRHALRAIGSILADRPLAVSYFVTNRCNFSCDFCEYPSFNTDKKRELSPHEIEQMAKKLARAGVVVVAIIGGEPFVRKDLPEVVRALSRHLLVQINTNGWMMDEARARAIFAAGVHLVNVSLDSSDEAQHDAGRRQPGSFQRALAAARLLRDAPKIARDQCVGFESVLSARNQHQLGAMVDIARELGVRIYFQPISGGHVEGSLGGIDRVSDSIGTTLHRLKDANEHVGTSRAMIDRVATFFRSGRAPDCGAGRTMFNIDAYGRITRCEEQKKAYGDLRDLDVDGIRAVCELIRADTKRDGCDTCYLRGRGDTEPLYGDFHQVLETAEDMFGVSLPTALPTVLELPGVKGAMRLGLGAASRLGALD